MIVSTYPLRYVTEVGGTQRNSTFEVRYHVLLLYTSELFFYRNKRLWKMSAQTQFGICNVWIVTEALRKKHEL